MGWLKELGYTHCFFLAGGNSMHLLEAASKNFKCVPFVHEVSSVIAAEYFNETNDKSAKAFSLVTAGPGLTNTVTGLAGAWLESRNVLVVGGQVKSTDIKNENLRQRGIQEIDGVALVQSITKATLLVDNPKSKKEIFDTVLAGESDRPGPVFIEFCIDVSGSPYSEMLNTQVTLRTDNNLFLKDGDWLHELGALISESKRPLLLLGNGVSRDVISLLEKSFADFSLPIASTWTGADRIHVDYPYYAGRPNTFGMRWANVFQQQADLIIAVGTRLNLQQTGFNWEQFAPVGKVVHVDIDEFELQKEHPKKNLVIRSDSKMFLLKLPDLLIDHVHENQFNEWCEFLEEIKRFLPVIEDVQEARAGFVEPYRFIEFVANNCSADDVIVSCSSGGTFTAVLQTFYNKPGQKLISNKGLASMGYGLAGAIGASFADPSKRVILFEGDGGFAQNLQELGTVSQISGPIKIFIFANSGYASIRASQRNYFKGNYVGCDIETGLGLPDWEKIAQAYDIEVLVIDEIPFTNSEFRKRFENNSPSIFVIKCDPEQQYLPKITSKIDDEGKMKSQPLHLMAPDLPPEVQLKVFRYLDLPSQHS
jgi:acetolactate synthase-1/2/3 large subunit